MSDKQDVIQQDYNWIMFGHILKTSFKKIGIKLFQVISHFWLNVRYNTQIIYSGNILR